MAKHPARIIEGYNHHSLNPLEYAMFEFSLLPQNAVLPVDAQIGVTNPAQTAVPFANVIDNLPPPPQK